MYERVRTRKSEVNLDIIYPKNEIRTTNRLWTLFILLVAVVRTSSTHIDFDDVETAWLKNVAIHAFPNGNVHSSILKITGLDSTDIEDGVHIKPTFSPKDCFGNETELTIIGTAAPLTFNSSLIVSLQNFHFKKHSEAYLCIRTKYDRSFQHMGLKSKISK